MDGDGSNCGIRNTEAFRTDKILKI